MPIAITFFAGQGDEPTLIKHVLVGLFACAVCSCAGPTRLRPIPSGDAPAPPIYLIEELTWKEIDALDRAPTLFILPLGTARATRSALAHWNRHACGELRGERRRAARESCEPRVEHR